MHWPGGQGAGVLDEAETGGRIEQGRAAVAHGDLHGARHGLAAEIEAQFARGRRYQPCGQRGQAQ